MINLISLIIIPLMFTGIVLYISNNFRLWIVLKETNSIKQVTWLEESNHLLPYVLRVYYSHLTNLSKYTLPSLKLTSFWVDHSKHKEDKEKELNKNYKTESLRKAGILLSLILYLVIIILWLKYSPVTLKYQLMPENEVSKRNWNLNISLGVDGISLPFLLLVGFILPIVFLSNWTTLQSLDVYYIIIIILLEMFLIIVFLVLDFIMFYVFFESTLPLLFVLIGLYGASQKVRAGFYLFLYTLFGSLFMLVAFVKIIGGIGSDNFENSGNNFTFFDLEQILWLLLLLSFSVKTPIVPVHIWLPLAHSDANVSGSILLASIVLKLALYAFLRISIGILFIAATKLNSFVLGLCSISILYSSYTTIRQFDLKVLVAYSSIAHMSSTLLGTFSNKLVGLVGSVVFGLAHGFVSPGLFILVGAILYDRYGSRIINYYKGLTTTLPFFALLFLLFVFGNMGVPLTANFIGEFLSLLGAFQQNVYIACIGATSIVLSAVYSIFMYNRVTGGTLSPYIHSAPDVVRKEFYMLLPLLGLTLILGVYPYFITTDIEFGLSSIIM